MIFDWNDKTPNKTMKTHATILTICIAIAGLCYGQEELQKRYNEEYDKSASRAIAAYPELATPDTPLAKKFKEIDNAFRASDDPRYYTSEKPMIIAQIASKELGIVPVAVKPDQIFDKPTPVMARITTTPWKIPEGRPVLGNDGKVSAWLVTNPTIIPELKTSKGDEFKFVKVTQVDPDGIRISHEDGVRKITIEELSTDQCLEYGLTQNSAAIFRQQVANNTAAYYARQQEAARQAQVEADAAAASEQERQEEILTNPPRALQAPVWKRFIQNEAFRKANRQGIADEIRRQDGDVAADRFLTDARLKDLEEAKEENETVVKPPLITRHLEGGRYQRRGDRITINGNLSGGYRIEGDKLYSFSSGAPTHTRSGSMWMPLDASHPQILDNDR